MTFDELQHLAASLPTEEIETGIRSLATDTRLAAIIALIQQHKTQYVDSGCEQRLANSAGSLAHNAGSIYSLNLLLGAIKHTCQPPRRRGQQPPEKPNPE